MSTRTDVLAEFTRGTVTRYFDTDAMADEIVRLRETVAAVEAERDDALIDRRFSDEQRAKWMAENVALLHRADRTERILAALREPSEAVVQAVKDTIYEELGIEYWDGKTRRILYYAIQQAEKEVGA